MTDRVSIEDLLAQCEAETGRFAREGTFADYLSMVTRNPSTCRLSHALVYDALTYQGVEETTRGDRVYGVFKNEIFGLEACLDRIVRYFASAARRMEVRKRILLLLGPPASGKSSVVDLIKRALERYTRTDAGAVFAIKGCPMQEEPLHLIPPAQRRRLLEDYGVYVEGDLCPRCRYVLRSEFRGRVSEMRVERVVFSEQEAVGIGYYLATNPNPTDASVLVGSVDTSRLEGGRLEVAGKAFRLDGELNVANRGLMEFVEVFKADKHMLTTLLGLAQEQVVKMERFGTLYADEAVIAHSNEGDFATFSADEHSEALKDRIIAVQVPYNLKVSEEVKIYRKMVRGSTLQGVHIAPLALRVASTFAVFSRLEPPARQGMSLGDKLRLYDGQALAGYTRQDVVEMQRHSPREGMSGISPRYVMNRLDALAASRELACLSPLAALDSLWQGLRENVSLGEGDLARYAGFVADAVKEYDAMAVRDIQRAHDESFEHSASRSLDSYLASLGAFCNAPPPKAIAASKEQVALERDMRDMERYTGVNDRNKVAFRREIHDLFSGWKARGLAFDYATEPRLKAAIEARLFPNPRALDQELTEPRFAKRKVEWAGRREAIMGRLMELYGYCERCADDLLDYATHILKSRPVVRSLKNEGIEWSWPLDPGSAARPSQ